MSHMCIVRKFGECKWIQHCIAFLFFFKWISIAQYINLKWTRLVVCYSLYNYLNDYKLKYLPINIKQLGKAVYHLHVYLILHRSIREANKKSIMFLQLSIIISLTYQDRFFKITTSDYSKILLGNIFKQFLHEYFI